MGLFFASFAVAFCGYLLMRVGFLLIQAQQEAMYYR